MTEEPNVESVCSLPINSIAITDWNPRKEFDKEKLNELAKATMQGLITEEMQKIEKLNAVYLVICEELAETG